MRIVAERTGAFNDPYLEAWSLKPVV